MLHQYQVHKTRHVTTAHLAQTMTLLNMSMPELYEKIEAELAENPALELTETSRCPTCGKTLRDSSPCPVCSNKYNEDTEVIIFESPRDYHQPKSSGSSIDDLMDEYDIYPEKIDLQTYVFKQIVNEIDEEDYLLVSHILTNTNEDGFLDVHPMEICTYHHVTMSKLDSLLDIIKRADPFGVCSRNPQEAMLVQLEILKDRTDLPNGVFDIVECCIEELGKHRYDTIAKKVGISYEEVVEAAHFITNNLNPFPGRASWGDVHAPVENSIKTYHSPDVIIQKMNEESDTLTVELITPYLGSLQVNTIFKKASSQIEEGEKKEQWKGNLDKASLFIKCLQQRNHTMKRLISYLVREQKDFITEGDLHLKPITRAGIAEELDVHESTISRAVSNKVVQLPNGRMIPMEKFFDRSLSVRIRIKNIIDDENQPLSDSKIAKILKKEGVNVARRTVAKYRSLEGILPAHQRKAIKNME